MPAILIATMKINDAEALRRYRLKAADALAKHGGSIIAAGPLGSVIEGSAPKADTAAIISFPDAGAANAWINDKELTSVHALRNEAGTSSIIMLG